MEPKVAVVGYNQIKNSSDAGKPRERLLFELARDLYKEMGITRHDIDAFVFCSNDFQAGRTISTVYEITPAGAYMKDDIKVELDGIFAAMFAAMRIMGSNCETALVIANSLGGSQFRPYLIMDYQLDPTFDRQLGILNELSSAALQARSYMDRYGMTEEQLNKIAARLLRNAARNPRALQSKADATPDDVAASELLYEPLRKLHCYPFTDGACLMLLASEKKAKELTDKPVWIKGMASSLDGFRIGERDLSQSPSTKLAAEAAYRMAGISDPAKDIDLAEVGAKFAHQEPIICEALGLFPEGSGGEVADKGLAEIGGEMPINPSGGGLGAYPFSAAGLISIAECCRQLRGEADGYQVAGAKTALAHGHDGHCLQQNGVMVLSTEEG